MNTKRPIYETAEDRERQLSALKDFLGNAKFIETKFEDRISYDAIILHNEVPKFLCEVKVRNCRFRDHWAYIIGKNKVSKLNDIARECNLIPFFLFKWEDISAYINSFTIEDSLTPRIGGRRDRNDPRDMELCYYVTQDMFRFKNN